MLGIFVCIQMRSVYDNVVAIVTWHIMIILYSFSPFTIFNSQDKRDREGIALSFGRLVERSCNKLGVVSLGINAEVDVDRSVQKITYSLPPIPNTPLEEFVNDPNNKTLFKELEASMLKTQLIYGRLIAAKKNNKFEEFANVVKINYND